MPAAVKQLVKKAMKRTGYEVIRRRPHLVDLLVFYGIDVVVDAGANEGQFAQELRSGGYRNRIVSFEPVPEAFEILERKAAQDGKWTAVNAGLGSEAKTVTIHVSRSTVFSSILTPLPTLDRFAGAAVEDSARREITLHTLDAELPRHVRQGERVFLKIDTQGYEREIVAGAREVLASLVGVQLELSLTPLYDGEATLAEMVSLLERSGMRMVLFEPVAYDLSRGTLLQVDCVFFRKGFGPCSIDG